MATEKYRILSIDGGGIKGVFPAAFLASVEDHLQGRSVAEYFDLIVGTSTGGIIAIGLGMGFRANEILEFYRSHGPRIFPAHPFTNYRLRAKQILKSKYTHTQLKASLEELLGTRRLGESRNRLVIPSFNLEDGSVYVFKTRHHPEFIRDYKETAVDVALSTASAPTFYPAHRLGGNIPLVDGGIWANNPIGNAVAEALGVLEWPAESIRVLSLGCTKPPYAANWARRKSLGFLYWAKNAPDLFMSGQSSGSTGLAGTLLRLDRNTRDQRLKRINPVAPPGRYSLDGIQEIDSLIGWGEKEARDQFTDLLPIFFDSLAPKFEPFPLPTSPHAQ